MNVEKAIEEFIIYTNPYVELSDNCTLKIDHTLRVVKLCEEIALSLGLDKKEIEVAKMIGLLHDIGRFEQWKRYNTFNDNTSIDHASLGVEILTSGNYIKKFFIDDLYNEIILNAIFFHNKYSCPNDLNEEEKKFIKIIRDADKIDILYLYTLEHLEIDTENQKMTDKIYNGLLNKKLTKREDVFNKADILSISLGFIFDINFHKSFEIINNNNYINKEIDIYINKTENKEFKNQLEEIRKVINKYIKERL